MPVICTYGGRLNQNFHSSCVDLTNQEDDKEADGHDVDVKHDLTKFDFE
jgi:hypothetical protein